MSSQLRLLADRAGATAAAPCEAQLSAQVQCVQPRTGSLSSLHIAEPAPAGSKSYSSLDYTLCVDVSLHVCVCVRAHGRRRGTRFARRRLLELPRPHVCRLLLPAQHVSCHGFFTYDCMHACTPLPLHFVHVPPGQAWWSGSRQTVLAAFCRLCMPLPRRVSRVSDDR